MAPWARLVAQILVSGAGIVGKAFMQAYQQAAAGGAANTAKQAASAAARRGKISKSEALQVLNFEKKPKSMNELIERYDTYFASNDPKKGGSLYLQSKVLRAKECLEVEYPEFKEANGDSEKEGRDEALKSDDDGSSPKSS